ncbi:MAG: hypothetical protein J5963_00950, partial [Schwartzia sp.]|nr:hypothetical protein [Schwartzia sp. (in: firmicutes)]
GAAVWANSEEKLAKAISWLLSSEEELTSMRTAAHEMKKPYAARDIADHFAEAFDKFSDWKKIHGE